MIVRLSRMTILLASPAAEWWGVTLPLLMPNMNSRGNRRVTVSQSDLMGSIKKFSLRVTSHRCTSFQR